MFLRAVKAPNGRHQYLRLVESVREGKKVKQRVVAHLGRKDQLAPHLDALIRLLQDETQAPRWVPIQDVSAPRASTWGPILVARHLFHHLSLGTIVDGERPLRRHRQLLSERIFPLLANRLTRPGSEHALAPWLEDYFVCNAEGSRWMPVWKQSRRVKVDFEQLRLWYQSLDDLRAQKARIEKQVFLELRNLFSLRPDLVFYDITSTFFEGAGPTELGRFGYSRDGKPRNRQIVIGVVMMDGWPIAHHVFAGNRLDQTTVHEVVQDLNQRFQLERVVFVGDRGMMTIGTVKQLRERQQGTCWDCNAAIARTLSTISNRQRRAATGNCVRGESRRGKRRWCRRRGWWRLRGKKPGCACWSCIAKKGSGTNAACAIWRWDECAKNWKP